MLFLPFASRVVSAGNRSNFLSHGPSVSAFGRGETVYAANNDVSASFYNPSYIAAMDQNNFNLAHFRLFDGTMYNYCGLGYLPGKRYAVGFSGLNLRSGDIEIRQLLNDTPKIINAGQWAFTGTFAGYFEQLAKLNAGINLKYLYVNLYDYSSSCFAADLGISREFKGLYMFGKECGIFTGISAQNLIQPKFRLRSEEETYARIYMADAALTVPVSFIYVPDKKTLYYDNLILSAGYTGEEEKAYLKFGAEYSILNKYFIRAGLYDGHSTFGFGYRFGSCGIDYAADMSLLAVFHKLGITYYYGENRNNRTVPDDDPASGKITTGEQNQLLHEALLKQEEERKEKQRIDKELSPKMASARKEGKKKNYLRATDKLKDILSFYPDYEPALKLYSMLYTQMTEEAKTRGEADFEDICYAKAYLSYYKNLNEDALNQWERVLQLNPDRSEVSEYSGRVKALQTDEESKLKEQESEAKVKILFEEGVKQYENAKWVQCIRKMEKVKSTCEKENLRSSLDWTGKADSYIKNSVEELSKTVVPDKTLDNETDKTEKEIDLKAAEKKYNQGLILYAQGKLSSAARMWEITLRFNPDHEKAKLALEKVKKELAEGKTLK